MSNGNAAMTVQKIEDIIVRNNIFDGGNRSSVFGIWAGPAKNVQLLNNTILRSNLAEDWTVVLYTNSKQIDGLVVRNNIIDGVSSDNKGLFKHCTFSNSLYTRLRSDQNGGMLGKDEIKETDLKKIFVDPDKDDFHLKPGSPAIGAGMNIGLEKDMSGTKLPQGKAPDLGAYQYSR